MSEIIDGIDEREIGLYQKYIVKKVHGDTDPNADYLVLRLDKDPAARCAAWAFMRAIKKEFPQLAQDLCNKLIQYDINSNEVKS